MYECYCCHLLALVTAALVTFPSVVVLAAAAAAADSWPDQVARFVSCAAAGASVNVVPVCGAGGAGTQLKVRADDELASDFTLVVVEGNALQDSDGLERTLTLAYDELLSHRSGRVKRDLVFVDSEDSDGVLRRLASAVAKKGEDAFFYLASPDSTGSSGGGGGAALTWHQVISVGNRSHHRHHPSAPVTNPLAFGLDGCMLERYDLAGTEVSSVGLTWRPFVAIEDCSGEDGGGCRTSGSTFEAASLLGGMLNFSLSSSSDPDGDWGVFPKEDGERRWGGVFGKVVYGDYELSIVPWLYNLQRDPLVDFVEFYHHTSLLVLIPQPPKIDPHLFFRPFTGQSWLWTLLAAAAVVLFSSAATSPRLPGAAWRRLAGLTHAGWFVLVHAYYCGALTMFFTRAPSIPFNTIRDVMRDDSWKLIVQDDTWASYQAMKDAGDPDYVRLWNRMVNDPEDTFYETYDDGMAKLREGRYVMQSYDLAMRAWQRANPGSGDDTWVFGKVPSQHTGFILTKSSPLTPALTLGMLRLRETGTLGLIIEHWVVGGGGGGARQPEEAMSKTRLSLGQVVLAFLMMGTAVATSLAVMAGEKVAAKVGGKRGGDGRAMDTYKK